MSTFLFLFCSVAIIVVAGSNPSSLSEFDCAARKFAFYFGLSKLRWATDTAATNIFDALRLHECHEPRLDFVSTSRHMMAEPPETTMNNLDTSCSRRIFVDATLGNDSSGDGSIHAPLLTLVAARDAARRILEKNATIVLRGGRYYLEDTLVLDHRDSGLTIMAFEKEHVVISGGDLIPVRLFPTKQNANIYSAHLSKHFEFTLLFHVNDNNTGDERLVWAREPNGHPERDLQPDGYARVAGRGTAGTWPNTKGIHVAVMEPARNSSIYPVFGQDLDPRGGGHWFHIGDERFADNKGFWNGTIMTGMRYNSTTGFNCSNWTRDGYRDAVAHVFHNALWGNWQFRIQSINTKTEQINFNASGMVHGGWQEGRGGRMGTQPFFVEGVWEALDIPGEWWLNRTSQTLYYYPHANETVATLNENAGALPLEFVAPRLKRLVAIMGQTSSAPATNISIRGVAFAHSATSFLDKYEVPSPGDWSIRREGALFLENAEDINVDLCRFVRTGGNAIFLSGHVKRASLTRNEFAWIGDSAVVTVGRIPMNDGYSVRTYPECTLIANNHFREIGIHGKQTSAIFSALSCRTVITGNVAYNGPRAGINLNDGFCHGHRIEENLLFNWVRETQDHGPINTWNRALYIQRNTTTGEPTVTPEWTHVSRNYIMNGPSGNRDLGNLFPTIDNDDGSSFFVMSNNFLVYGGVKNYLGHTKTWSRNLIAYPGRWSGDPCAQLWGGPNHIFEGNTCIVGHRQRPLGLDGTIKGNSCIIDWDDPSSTENVAWSSNNTYFLDDVTAWWFSCGNRTASSHRFTLAEMQSNGREVDSSVRNVASLSADAIIALARQTLHQKTRVNEFPL